jgi:hypothetical protein
MNTEKIHIFYKHKIKCVVLLETLETKKKSHRHLTTPAILLQPIRDTNLATPR